MRNDSLKKGTEVFSIRCSKGCRTTTLQIVSLTRRTRYRPVAGSRTYISAPSEMTTTTSPLHIHNAWSAGPPRTYRFAKFAIDVTCSGMGGSQLRKYGFTFEIGNTSRCVIMQYQNSCFTQLNIQAIARELYIFSKLSIPNVLPSPDIC